MARPTRTSRFNAAYPRDMRGVSLVELMVAMVLSLVLLGGALALFAGTRGTYETIDQLSRVQENGRFALDRIVRDLRTAGYVGCAKAVTNWRSTLNTPTTLAWNFSAPVQGFEGASASAWSPTLDSSLPATVIPLTDVIAIRMPESSAIPARLNVQMANGTSPFQIAASSPAQIASNDVVMISDCESQAFVEVTGVTTVGTDRVLSHNASSATSTSPGNASNDAAFAFKQNAEIIPFVTHIYYIAPSVAGTSNALWRRVGTGTSQELIEGVDSMQVLYGVDSDADQQVNQYVNAGAVTDWTRVVAVRVALLVRSVEQFGDRANAQTYAVLDRNISDPQDRRVRQVFSTTVTLRNKAL